MNDVVLHYDGLVQDMAVKHGQMFDIRDYPTDVEVSSKFKIRLYVSEVPSHDFRCQVSEDIAADLKQQYQEQADDIVHRVID